MRYLAWSDIINLSWLFFVFVLVGFFSIMMKVFAFNSLFGAKVEAFIWAGFMYYYYSYQ